MSQKESSHRNLWEHGRPFFSLTAISFARLTFLSYGQIVNLVAVKEKDGQAEFEDVLNFHWIFF